jgi:hypothetical protein
MASRWRVECLRRERRRLDARDQLRTAHEMFIGMGVKAFAERAERASWRLASAPESAPSSGARTSPPRRPRSPGWPAKASPTRRSARDCSSAQDRRVPPEEGLQQAGHHFSHPARPRAPATDRRGAAGLNQAGLRRDRSAARAASTAVARARARRRSARPARPRRARRFGPFARARSR